MPLRWVRESFPKMKLDLGFEGCFKIFPRVKSVGRAVQAK